MRHAASSSARYGLIFALFLVSLEVTMRRLGAGIMVTQERDNEIRPEDSRAIRIVAIGDSNIVGEGSSDDETFPAQLSRLTGLRVYDYGGAGLDNLVAFLKDPRFLCARDPPSCCGSIMSDFCWAIRCASMSGSSPANCRPQRGNMPGRCGTSRCRTRSKFAPRGARSPGVLFARRGIGSWGR